VGTKKKPTNVAMSKCTVTEASYQRGCRCPECTTAHRLYRRERDARIRLAKSQDEKPKRKHVKRDTPMPESDALTLGQVARAHKDLDWTKNQRKKAGIK